ncbi:MAG: hypothetical protein EZS28_050284 [Streblomastix strix]|uniref:Uncharacterized protein n=1 Tax=Streblomastix strix TaxID=222440 RepID=A0A5J4T7F1_9EUKA|nr:MAG: hypothetical protein EZS28_050284 [Streblomastix strix]
MKDRSIVDMVHETEMEIHFKNAKVILIYSLLKKELENNLKLNEQQINLFSYFMIMLNLKKKVKEQPYMNFNQEQNQLGCYHKAVQLNAKKKMNQVVFKSIIMTRRFILKFI